MKIIPLSGGKVCKVDDSDFEFLNQWKWSASGTRNVYAFRWDSKANGKRGIFMHKLLLNATGETYGDHRNGDTLDNQKSNLRPASNSQNLANRGPTKSNTSGFKGVSFNKKSRKWGASITKNMRQKHLGFFTDRVTAAEAYDRAAEELFGEFARTNLSLGLLCPTYLTTQNYLIPSHKVP